MIDGGRARSGGESRVLVIAVTAALAWVFASCGGSSTTSAASSLPSPTTAVTTAPVTTSSSAVPSTTPSTARTTTTSSARAILAPATVPPVADECSLQTTDAADGNVFPLLCPAGGVNVTAWNHY